MDEQDDSLTKNEGENISDIDENSKLGDDIEELQNIPCSQEKEYHEGYKPSKRGREEDEEQWNLVTKGKKMKEEKSEVYISCREKLPKQFSLAKIFKNLGIHEINKIKYLNPYKIRLEIKDDYIEKLTACEELIEKGWKFQRAFEVNFSYGIIKDVDLELTEADIMDSIRCPSPGVLISVNRLQRRDKHNGWIPCETVRLCFKDTYLPPYVTVEGLQIRVEAYVFPVSQCSRCWKLGHTAKRCPSNSVICPKCANNHENCDTTVFKCVNCRGNHMALLKSCPEYVKEKKIRQIMSEFNCTYRRARTMYVSTSPKRESNIFEPSPGLEQIFGNIDVETQNEELVIETLSLSPPDLGEQDYFKENTTYANKVKMKTVIHKENNKYPKQNKHRNEYKENENIDLQLKEEKQYTEENSSKEITFSELLARLKEIIFLRSGSLKSKVHSVIKCCTEWFILLITENIADWPVLKMFLDYFNG